MSNESKKFPWLYLLILSSVTFMGILSELMPSGVLPEMSGGLQVSYAAIGFLVSIYAIASAVGTIPLITWTMPMDRKKLLLILILVFAVSNTVIALSGSYQVIVIARLIGGISAGVLWPLVSAYAIRLVPAHLSGRAIAVAMAGSTLGIGIGLPIMTAIGTTFGWRVEFGVLSVILFVVAVLGYLKLPAVPGEKRSAENSPFTIIKNKSVIICLVVTFLTIMAHYALYTYISPLVTSLSLSGGINLTLIIFGIGTILSVLLAAKVVDQHLGRLTASMLILAFAAMILLAAFKGTPIVAHAAFFLWGISFGALVSIFQTAVTRQVDTGKDVATSLQSSTFNFGIVFGSLLGGSVLERFSAFHIIYLSLGLLIVPILLSVFARKTFYQTESQNNALDPADAVLSN